MAETAAVQLRTRSVAVRVLAVAVAAMTAFVVLTIDGNPARGQTQEFPNPPNDVVVIPAPGEVTVTWSAADEGGPFIDGYLAFLRPGTDQCERLVEVDGQTQTEFSCTFTGLDPDADYRIRVRSRSELVERVSENVERGFVSGVPPPSRVTVGARDEGLAVEWRPPIVTGIGTPDDYVVRIEPGDDTDPCLPDSEPFACYIVGLTNDTDYTVTVRSSNEFGLSRSGLWPGTPQAGQGTATPKPPLPSNIVVTPGDQRVEVSWSDPTDPGVVDDYNVFTRPASDSCVTTDNECVLIGLFNGTEYEVVLQSRANGRVREFSTFVTPGVQTPATTPPAPPTDVVVTPGVESLDVSWTASPPPADPDDQVDLYIATAEPGGAICSTTTTGCVIGGLDPDVEYSVTVTARNEAGDSISEPALGTPASDTTTTSTTTTSTTTTTTTTTTSTTTTSTTTTVPSTTSAPTTAPDTTAPTAPTVPSTTAPPVTAPTTTEPPVAPPALIGVTPARLYESRPAPEGTGDGEQQDTGIRTAGGVTTVEVVDRYGVPADTAAAVVNLTIIDPDRPGFATAYPCTDTPPTASTINHAAGQTIANAATVPLDDDGQFCVFTSATTHLAIDLAGVVPAGSDIATAAPARFFETRSGPDDTTVDGEQQQVGRLAAGSVAEVQIGDRNGIDAGVTTALLNVAVIDPAAPGFVTLYPCDEERPTASTLNHAAGQTVANGAAVKVDALGRVCVYTHAEADLIVDVVGHAAASDALTTVSPVRLYETRVGPDFTTVDGLQQGTGRRSAGQETRIEVIGRADVPDDATAVMVNVAAIAPPSPGFVTLYPCDETRPGASTVNYAVGGVIANNATVKLGADGALCAFTLSPTDLIIDLTGYLT